MGAVRRDALRVGFDRATALQRLSPVPPTGAVPHSKLNAQAEVAPRTKAGRSAGPPRGARRAGYDRPAGAPDAPWDKGMGELEKKSAKSRKISPKPADIGENRR